MSPDASAAGPPRRRLQVLDARPEPAPRGIGLMQALQRPFLALERVVSRALPEQRNPFAQTGAIANTTFLVALVSGIALLFWYVPSVQQAYGSLEAMRGAPLAQLVRSLHRYSSDACVLFVALHALRYLAAARITGARWLAWVTGIAGLGLLWFDGFIGYWLVWDQRGQLVALGTARMLDVLPIFVDPLSRSFLTDEGINSLLFFIVFFAHMLVPLLIGVALWLHITRLRRPHFLTGRNMTLWVLGSLVLVSLTWPATSAAPAKMLAPPDALTMDYFYLLPLALTDRLSGGLLWLLALTAGLLSFSLPWTLRRGPAPAATVDTVKCNDCRICAADCPYGAIDMLPRTDDKSRARQAVVNPSKCVGCGVCAGSCDSSAIGLPWLSAIDVRRDMDAFLERVKRQDAPHVAFACASSAGGALRVDPGTGLSPDLPGYLVWAVPCAGWVHAQTVARALRHGARRVLVVACGEGQCAFREGALATEERLAGDRTPSLQPREHASDALTILRQDRGRLRDLQATAAALRAGRAPPAKPRSARMQQLAGAGLALGLSVVTVAPSDAPYRAPLPSGPELVVSFSHPGQSTERCHTLTAAEKLALPVHMRRDRVCDRSRADVRLRVTMDGKELYVRPHRPSGLYADMNSIAAVHLTVPPGTHQIGVALGDTHDPDDWRYRDQRTVAFSTRLRRVVVFDRTRGFRWY